MTDRGRFVVLDGGEGCGKSTQVPRVAHRLESMGRQVVVTFEPGATARGSRLRALLLDDHSDLDARAELLLMAADRAQHVSEIVRPALERGADVVSDRFSSATLAYQGIGRGLGVDAVDLVNGFATDGLEPDVVVVLDVDDEVARARLGTDLDRFEAEGGAFHRKVRAAYRELAVARDWVVVDGSGSPDEVEAAIWDAVSERLDLGTS